MSDLHAEDSKTFKVTSLCRLFGASKQAYYQYDDNGALSKAARESFALEYMQEIRQIAPGMGGKKLWEMYLKEFSGDKPIGRDRFYRLIDENGLKVRRRIRKPRTTDSRHGLPTYPDIAKDYIPEAPNRLWVSDITYIPINTDRYRYYFCYLSLIMDAYTEEIIGWSVGPNLDAEYPLKALEMALERTAGKEENLIHHSDRGVQYASRAYVKRLTEKGIRVSMTESGDPKDNAQAERINNTMKNELLKGKTFNGIDEVISAVAVAVDFYNNRRPHMSIGMRTPSEMRKVSGDRKMMWKSLRQAAIRSRQAEENAEKCLPLDSCAGSPSALRAPVNPAQE